MTRLKCKGEWYYIKIKPDCVNELDAPLYELYNASKEFVMTFGSYGDMKYYVEHGIIL